MSTSEIQSTAREPWEFLLLDSSIANGRTNLSSAMPWRRSSRRYFTARVTEFRRNLETRTSYAYLAEARQLYDWLIRPLQPWFREHEIDTLVFVPDGALRTIPFASLHDGEHFLIEDLAVAVAPGSVARESAVRACVRSVRVGVVIGVVLS